MSGVSAKSNLVDAQTLPGRKPGMVTITPEMLNALLRGNIVKVGSVFLVPSPKLLAALGTVLRSSDGREKMEEIEFVAGKAVPAVQK